MIRISHTRSKLISLALCASLFTSPVLAGGAGNGNGQGNNIQARVDALEKQVTTLTQDVQDLQGLSQQLTDTQGDVTALAGSDTTQNETLKTLTQQLLDLQKQLQDTQSQLTAADGALQEQLKALNDTLAQTQGQLDTLNKAALDTQKTLDALQTTDTGLQNQVNALKDVDAGTQQGLTDLQKKLSDLQVLLDDYKKTTASQAQLAELQKQISDLQGQITALDPAQFYKRDGSVALTGTLAGGGQDAANLRNISASGTVSATKLSAVNITPEMTVVAGSACDPTAQGSLAKDSAGSLLSCQAGMWINGGLAGAVTTYEDSCTQCNRSTNMGAHKVCALTKVAGPGGLDTNCEVRKVGKNWFFYLYDGTEPGQTQACAATCFD